MRLDYTKNKILYREKSPIELYNCSDIIIISPAIKNVERAVYLWNCKNVTVIGAMLTNIHAGVVAVECNDTIVTGCSFRNIKSKQAVQFDKCTHGAITHNSVVNIEGKSSPEDSISLYMTHGTKDSPVIVAYNTIRGGGPSKSGGGIMLGDNGGSWLVASNNRLINPGQYGISISGGSDNSILNNKVASEAWPFSNVGIYTIGKQTVEGNDVEWYNKKGVRNDYWFGEKL